MRARRCACSGDRFAQNVAPSVITGVRFVFGMAAYVLAIRAGSAPGPYTSARAERFARLMLIDDEEFRFLEERRIRDYLIAGHFGVPIEQVREKRLDQLADQADRS